MPMTISIYLRSLNFCLRLFLLCLIPCLSNAATPRANHVPADSFLVLSVKAEALIGKSKILESSTWAPLLEKLALSQPTLHEILLDRNSSGLNLQTPIRLYARTDGKDSSLPSFGLIAMVKDPKKTDRTLAEIAESLGLEKRKGKGTRYGKEGFPMGIGRKGRLCFLLGIAPNSKGVESVEDRLNEFHQAFLTPANPKQFPASLKSHLNQSADLALYLDGTGLAKIIEDFWPDDQWKKLLPALDDLFNRQIGFHFQSSPGTIRLTATEYSRQTTKENADVPRITLLDQLPGDSPLVARLSLQGDSFRSAAIQSIDHALKFLSNGKINKDSNLPGFDASASELLSFPSGDFVFAGGTFKSRIIPTNSNQATTVLDPSFLLGVGVSSPITFKRFMAGLNSAKSLDALLDIQNLHLSEDKSVIWLSTFDFLREVQMKKPLFPLSKSRKKLLENHFFALDLDIQKTNQALRKLDSLSYDQLKTLSWAQDFAKLTLWSSGSTELTGLIKAKDKSLHGWEVFAKHLGQEMIDSINENLYRAISTNNFEALAQAIEKGALINANDRFGHTPLHFTAYRGNARMLQYLLRKGGNPNARGRHDSTPLHSAAWGRNVAALEVLLEEGSDVDARTDEGETPGMTAALRGEKEILEILFALSADPHAKDRHGTNLIDLAGAGGHRAIVEMLRRIGVKNKNPLHIAAGLGEQEKVKKLLQSGRKINDRDSFGATPLLIAMVAGQEKMVDFLLSRKADPKITAKEGYTLMHGAAFSGKKSLVRKALSLGLEVNARYGVNGITPTDVAEDEGDALPYLRALGGRTAWELGRKPDSTDK
ncbi:MAG: hypothetical protein CMI29_10475 [Opitutae bacterium]|nr:hypothetical protein [Opitutae bacterium]|tara:strand:+ start:4277 stop:6745 length:2469 start_codon:yes stop_codon:yes gene_type:complete